MGFFFPHYAALTPPPPVCGNFDLYFSQNVHHPPHKEQHHDTMRIAVIIWD